MTRHEAVRQLEAVGCTVVPTTRPWEYDYLRDRIRRSRANPPIFTRVNQCLRKCRYESVRRAKLAAKRTQQPECHAYRCVYCHGWHVGKRVR